MRKLILLPLLAMAGCAYSIEDVDVSKSEPACVRQSTVMYSSCIQGGPIIGSKMETLRAWPGSLRNRREDLPRQDVDASPRSTPGPPRAGFFTSITLVCCRVFVKFA